MRSVAAGFTRVSAALRNFLATFWMEATDQHTTTTQLTHTTHTHGATASRWETKGLASGRFRISLDEDQFYEASVCCDMMMRTNTRWCAPTNISPSTGKSSTHTHTHFVWACTYTYIDMYS